MNDAEATGTRYLTGKNRAPAWVLRLVTEECKLSGGLPCPVRWGPATTKVLDFKTHKRVRQFGSHGHCNQLDGMTVFAGTDVRDQRLLVIHELGHWIVDSKGHSATFWAWVFEAYKRHRLARYGLKREAGYREGAIRGAATAGIISQRTATRLVRLRRDNSYVGQRDFLADVSKAAKSS